MNEGPEIAYSNCNLIRPHEGHFWPRGDKHQYYCVGVTAMLLDEQPVDYVNHPPHYTQHPSGVECITITRHMNFNLGNAIKYVWRAGLKGGGGAKELEDLEKARWYIQNEIDRLQESQGKHGS
jgi:hypothetical protein